MKKKVRRSIRRTRDLLSFLAGPWRFRYPPAAAPALCQGSGPVPWHQQRAPLAWVPVRSHRQSNRPGSTP